MRVLLVLLLLLGAAWSLPLMLKVKKAYSDCVNKYGSLNEWSASAIDDFGSKCGFSAQGRKSLSQKKGYELLLLPKVESTSPPSPMSASITFKLITTPSIFTDPEDKKLWSVCWDVFEEVYSFQNLKDGKGAEDENLWSIFEKNPATSRTFLALLSRNPHLALGLLRASYGTGIDDAWFGKDESVDKSPWTWTQYVFSPGILACKYFSCFYDTNPYLVVLLTASYAAGDLAFYMELILFVSGFYGIALQSFAMRSLSAVLIAVPTFISYSVLPSWLMWLFRNAVVTYVMLIGLTLFNLFRLFRFAINFQTLLKWLAAEKSVVVSSKRSEVLKVIKSLDENPDRLLPASDWKALYDRKEYLGKGTFGTVYRAETKSEPIRNVAIKFANLDLRGKVNEEQEKVKMVLAVSLIFCGIAGDELEQGMGELNIEKLSEGMMQKNKSLYRAAEKDCILESKVLQCVAAIKSPYLLEFISAHKDSSAYTLVTNLAAPKGLSNEPLAVRLSAVQTFFAGMAALHEGGIVHRDLKMDNIAVSAADHSQAVVIDWGVCELPGEKRDHMVWCTDPRYSSPEMRQITARGRWIDKATLTIIRGFQGPAFDVWAAGLTAIEMVMFGCREFTESGGRPCILEGFKYGGNISKGFGLYEHKWMSGNLVQDDIDKTLLAPLRKHWNTGVGGMDPAVWRKPVLETDGLLKDCETFCKLVSSMVCVDRGRRITMKQAASHSFWHKYKLGQYKDQQMPLAATSASASASGFFSFGGGSQVSSANAAPSHRHPPKLAIKMLAQAIDILNASTIPRRATPSIEADKALVNKLKEEFPKHAKNKGECGSAEELVALLEAAGVRQRLGLTSQQVHQLFALVDTDKSGTVSKQELFVALVMILMPSFDASARLELLFIAADENCDGSISKIELLGLLDLFDWSRHDSERLFAGLDANKDGGISVGEWLEGMNKVELFPKHWRA